MRKNLKKLSWSKETHDQGVLLCASADGWFFTLQKDEDDAAIFAHIAPSTEDDWITFCSKPLTGTESELKRWCENMRPALRGALASFVGSHWFNEINQAHGTLGDFLRDFRESHKHVEFPGDLSEGER
jgi:hypothetical protein